MHISAAHLAARVRGWQSVPGPLYLRLAETMRTLAESGVLTPGSRLPSERALADTLAVSRNTVTAAYIQLREAGWLVGRPGAAPRIGSVCHITAADHSARDPLGALFGADTPNAVDLSVAGPDAAPAVITAFAEPDALCAGAAAPTEGDGYHPAGHPELVAAITSLLRRTGVHAAPDQLVVTNGAQQALSLTATVLRRARRPIAMESLSYPGAIDAIRPVARGNLVTLPVADVGMDDEAASRLIAATRPSAAYLTTFQNPTGTSLSTSQAEKLLGAARAAGTILVEDRTLADLTLKGQPAPPLAALAPQAPVLTIGSMSKLFWGGLRIGWIHANATLASHLRARRAAHDLGSPAPIQLLAAWLLDEHYERTRRWRVRALRTSLAALTSEIDRAHLGWRYQQPRGGPNLWLRLPPTCAASEYAAAAIRYGVRIVAGPAFAVSPGLGDDAIRLPFYRRPRELAAAVNCLAAAWRDQTAGPGRVSSVGAGGGRSRASCRAEPSAAGSAIPEGASQPAPSTR